MKKAIILLSVILYFTGISNSTGQAIAERQWPSYRGYLASGVLDNAGIPDIIDPVKMVNIRWKVPVPGLGLSSPVVWNNKVFLTTAISSSDKKGFKTGIYGDIDPVADSSVHEWKVICYDKTNGKVLWEKIAAKGVPQMRRHPKSTHANSTVATDGKYVLAFFGSEGLYCYDMDGKLIWEKNFGPLKSVFFMARSAEWEFASSPIICKGVAIIQCDVLENSFLAAYDIKSGKELWKTMRDEYPGWCTPTIYSDGGKDYIAVNGFKNRGGYDFTSGEEVWKMSGGGDIQIPTPIPGMGLIYFNSAHGRNSPILAVKTDARGDITLKEGETTNEYIKWSLPRGGSYMHTMLLYDNRLYNVNWNGGINCLDPLTGKEIFTAKLGKTRSFVASPVASDGKIYIVDEEGTVYVLQAADTFKLIGQFELDDASLTVPALTDGAIIFRTQKYLICAGKTGK